MPMYDYRCIPGNHTTNRWCAMGAAPASLFCFEHHAVCQRDFTSQRANTNDQFRSYYLSGKGNKAASAQGRAIAGPRDKHEAKELERETGRIYIGDDSDRLSEKGQRALSKTFAHNEKGAQ